MVQDEGFHLLVEVALIIKMDEGFHLLGVYDMVDDIDELLLSCLVLGLADVVVMVELLCFQCYEVLTLVNLELSPSRVGMVEMEIRVETLH